MTETEKQKQPEADHKRGDREDQKDAYVEQRLRDIAAFERRARMRGS